MTALVSVIIPCFNPDPAALRKSIDSVLNQCYSNIELLVVDDGSECAFSGVNVDYEQVSRIRFFSNDINGGVSMARNIGINHAKGDYLAFLDCGDWWDRSKVQKQLALFDKLGKEYGLVYNSALTVTEEGKTRLLLARYRGSVYKHLLIRQILSGSASSVMIRRCVVGQIGVFYEGGDIPEDRDYWIRISKVFKVDYVNEVLTYIEVVRGSRSADPGKKAVTYRRLIDMYAKEMLLYDVYGSAMAHYYLALAIKYKTNGLYGKMFGCLWSSICQQPCGSFFLFYGIVKNRISAFFSGYH